jgi:hypothetical protein
MELQGRRGTDLDRVRGGNPGASLAENHPSGDPKGLFLVSCWVVDPVPVTAVGLWQLWTAVVSLVFGSCPKTGVMREIPMSRIGLVISQWKFNLEYGM